MIGSLRPFQRRFIRGALAPGIDVAACSLPRANGKSALAGHLISRFLTPGDPIHEPGKEAILLSGSIEQSRIVFKFCRTALEPTGEYRFIDSVTRVGIVHKATNTRLRVHGSNSKTAFGIVGVPFVVWDEPGAAETVGGEALWDAVVTAMGKPGSPLKAILIGTLAPAVSGWWHDLIEEGSTGSTFVLARRGDPDRWDRWPEIRRCNPLTSISPSFRAKLIEERNAARVNDRLKARFKSYRLNCPTAAHTEVVISSDDWRRVERRDVAPRVGRPVVGIDLGAENWTAAACAWPNGRIEVYGVLPGVPGLADRERRYGLPRGSLARLVDDGTLTVDPDRRTARPEVLIDLLESRGISPALALCDRFKHGELLDSVAGRYTVEPRRMRWSEATADIEGFRRLALDGPLSIPPEFRRLAALSLDVARVKSEEGNLRITRRALKPDDVTIALVMAAGRISRELAAAAAGAGESAGYVV